MLGVDLENMRLYHLLAFGGCGLALLALVLSFVLPKGVKVPVAILGTVAGLVAGFGIGVIGMAAFGYRTSLEDNNQAAVDVAAADKGKGKGGMPGMGMPGMGKGKGAGPSPKAQLETLVVKIHQLTDKPLTLTLSSEQRTAIREQLKELGDKEELSDEDAKARLDAILGAVKTDQGVLEAAGYRWPAQGGGGMQPPPVAYPNPFKQGPSRERLTALQTKLGKE